VASLNRETRCCVRQACFKGGWGEHKKVHKAPRGPPVDEHERSARDRWVLVMMLMMMMMMSCHHERWRRSW
jgi:hypothetical protein